jgi:hypothetical protein
MSLVSKIGTHAPDEELICRSTCTMIGVYGAAHIHSSYQYSQPISIVMLLCCSVVLIVRSASAFCSATRRRVVSYVSFVKLGFVVFVVCERFSARSSFFVTPNERRTDQKSTGDTAARSINRRETTDEHTSSSDLLSTTLSTISLIDF